jgi:dihydroneopterin aldolase
VSSVTVTVKKPEPPIAGAVLGYAGVEITRSR